MSKQRGMALLMVLLMMSLMATIAVGINGYWQRSLVRAQSQQAQLAAKWLLLGGEIYAGRQLQRALDKQATVHPGQAWARDDLALRTEQGEVTIRLRSADDCFNLNALANAAREKRIFMLLLNNLGATERQAEEIAGAVIARYDQRDEAPAAGWLLADVSQLREIPAIDRQLYQRAAPLLCAFPDRTLHVNLNTVTAQQAPLLRALLLNGLSEAQTLALIAGRPASGWRSTDFLFSKAYPGLQKQKESGAGEGLTTRSRRFSADMQTVSEEGRYRLTSTLRYDDGAVTAIRREFSRGAQ